jgi:hypothetical protein
MTFGRNPREQVIELCWSSCVGMGSGLMISQTSAANI